MRLLDYIATAQTNLLRTRTRTFLTVLAFVIGTFTLGMVTAFTQGVRAYVDTQLRAYGQPNLITVTVKSSAAQASSSGVPYYQPNRQAAGMSRGQQVYTLTDKDLSAVRSVAGVTAAYPQYGGLQIDYINYPGAPNYLVQTQAVFPEESAALAAGALPSSTQASGIVLPYPYVEAFNASSPAALIGKTVTMQVSSPLARGARIYRATITGILPDTLHQPSAFVSPAFMEGMVHYQAGDAATYSSIAAFASSTVTPSQRQAIKQALAAKGYDAETYDDLLSSFSKPLSIVTAGLVGFAAIALLAATIGIVNTLLMAVLERTQEIGLLKALGMRRRGITFMYLVEAASIGFWGGVIGVALAVVAGIIANPILNRTLFKGVGTAHLLAYPLPYMAAIVIGAMIVGLLAGTLPAVRAGRLDPIAALRHE